MEITILIQLLLAHVLTDFVLQTDKWVKKKREYGVKSLHFWFHGLLSGILTYLLLQQWGNWWAPLTIIITHIAIDYWKLRHEKGKSKKNKHLVNAFVIDQLLHLLVILLLWLTLINGFGKVFPFIAMLFTEKNYLAIVFSAVVLIWPAGIIIGKTTKPFRQQIDMGDSLTKAGLYIGVLERLLVFVFIIIGQYAAIGFLIAAKSILRITKDNNKDSKKKTEYVLIGTMLSFTVAILVGLLTKSMF
ncbi:DUF3307 domain-containing protein [Perlabentimonas gracilis]|uniref:DUF3307 domain-containing protein n=1 Tax=Perlabentimonas gracilis TaxID=2715279 RepID=UPI00140A0F06|nr:DUF3307 domain-containing protein [Perlabentimonas gracilis]NHB69606.1 DUF3307 domain-containing protein [Perlabentimonas gracilis]